MNTLAACALSAVIGYLLGTLNPAYLYAKLRGIDIHDAGTGNPGASNTMILFGWVPGVAVGALDILKAAAAVLICGVLFPAPPLCRHIAGAAAILGHLFPFYLQFRGGKGFAPCMGAVFALSWKLGLVVGVLVIVTVLLTDYMALAAMVAAFSYPIYGAVTARYLPAAILLVAAVFMLIRHRKNFARIRAGTEVGLRRANRGELRVDRPQEKQP